ncbi:MAG: menaquinone biosynthesis protein [Bryobacterales bacterium]|nr:menaquinone biosynthesis protein [Bryobacterales bacterium]
MLASDLEPIPDLYEETLRVCAVSYLNTAPLIYSLQQAPSLSILLEMAVPAVCAERLRAGKADIGLVPVAEIARQHLAILGNVGIASDGPVRSILMFARKPWREVRTLAGDSSSRTSVLLAQILLRERYHAAVSMHPHPPEIDAMLATHDAALIIGDSALRLDPARLPYSCLDLGDEWRRHTGLPMVFAAWAGTPSVVAATSPQPFSDSLLAGLANLEDIVDKEAPLRGISHALALDYLRSHIRFRLGEREFAGMQEFLNRARQHGLLDADASAHPAEFVPQPVGNFEEQ